MSTSAVAAYVDEVKKYKMLTRAEEQRLGKSVVKGDLKARNALVEGNLRLVFEIARKYLNLSKSLFDFPDLVQEFNIGLINAAEAFDYERGKFSVCAYYYMRSRFKSITKKKRPKNTNYGVSACFQDPGAEKDFKEIEDRECRQRNAKIVRQQILLLPDRDRQILERYYGFYGHTPEKMEDIGDSLGIRKQAVFQIIEKSKDLLRENLRESFDISNELE